MAKVSQTVPTKVCHSVPEPERFLPPLVDGQRVAVRPLDRDRNGEANFVRMSWYDSFTFAWTPWPKLAEWERMPKDWQGKFKALVAGRLAQSRLSRPRRKTWLEGQKRLIEFAVQEDPVFVACLADDPDVLLGFLACRLTGASKGGPLLPHYAYVSRRVRHKGIARFLCDSVGITPNPFVHCDFEAVPLSTISPDPQENPP